MANIELIRVGEKLYPAAITNYSLSMGEKYGMLPSSNLDIMVESDQRLWVIYLSVIGMNKYLELSPIEFRQRYTPQQEEFELNYTNLIMNCTDVKKNNFAKGLSDSVSKKVEPGQKKIKSPKLNVECVEDRYVLYCLAVGIDSDIFWHYPIPDVERIYQSKQAWDSWKNNPRTV
ncbi:hypothetical protein [Virgibacillus oceani]|uniref:Uncharacterized protein n=1 Tax=Virgibacillus oceani TaxID=1479511 RepID=A0A917H2G1_9BACI|nr:hypothetical protein [Virgibacillus oceani]GGG64790.1 hypothetical protein GCM10011398_05510 [Virgibacillus oceani]